MNEKSTLRRGFSRETFILRMWQETSTQPGWRGQVQHVRTGNVVTFQDLDAMFAYLQALLPGQEAQLVPDTSARGLR